MFKNKSLSRLKTEKGIAQIPIIIIIAILAIAGTGAGVYFWQSNKTKQEKQTLEGDKQNLQKQIDELNKQIEELKANTGTTDATDQTANWKTYTNEKFGYEVKYPQDWFLYDRLEGDNAGTYSNYIGRDIRKFGKTQKEATEWYDGAEFSVEVAKNPKSYTLEAWIKEMRSESKIKATKTNISISNNIPAVKYVSKLSVYGDETETEVNKNSQLVEIYLEKNSQYFCLSWVTIGPDYKTYASTLDLILSTFKFTN